VAFQPGEGSAARLRQEIVVASDLRQVIDENRLVLFGQEIVPLRPEPGAKKHYEVLVRMLDRQYTLVGPGAFIPAAERFSIMDEVDDWILREAITVFGQRIAKLGDVEISLNLSANSLDNPGLLQVVMNLLETSPLSASAITFEITESAALSQVSTASRVMAGLKDLGCRVALDDFGMGSSSLSYLKHFPVDVVKLDGSFISNMLTSEVDYAIVRSINDLAHRIGAKTVAEFVEDEATLEAVSAIGVDYVQGFLHGAPRPLDQILKGLARSATA
jgi:EAL domain-containing protein (putative c-di-GMP-specific phosphodiesterase class I)